MIGLGLVRVAGKGLSGREKLPFMTKILPVMTFALDKF